MDIKRLATLVAIGLVIGGGAFAAIWYFGRDKSTPGQPTSETPPVPLPMIPAALLEIPAPAARTAVPFFDATKPEVKELRRIKCGEGGTTLAFLPDGKHLVGAGYGDMTVRVWDWQTGTEVTSRKHAYRVNHMAIAPQGTGIWTVDAYQHLCFWGFDGSTLGPANEVGKEVGQHPYLAVSPNGALVATTSFDRKLTFWNALEPSKIGEITVDHPMRKAAFSPDGKRLTVSTNTNQLIEYTLATGQGRWLHILPVKADTECTHVVFSPDGKRFSTCHTQPWVTVWDGAAMTYQRWLKFPEQAPTAVTYTRDSRWVVFAVNRNGIYCWNPDDNADSGAALNLKPGHDFLCDLAFSPDGRVLASCDDAGTIVLWSSP